MNIPKLKGKIVEQGMNMNDLADKIGIDRSTLYRRLTKSFNGDKFSVGELKRIRTVLSLDNEDIISIFFS